ncbi:MAG TPA: hypothetical protein VK927_08685, partial [Adhaeribacter sp.]|nr:hypothetical protein [Adhaeribacter sp.]
YLPPAITYQPVMAPEMLPQLKQQGFTHLLLDDYRKVTNVPGFKALEQERPVFQSPEPHLAAPLLFLEHSEYTGLGFSETMALHQQSLADTVQLKLIRIP